WRSQGLRCRRPSRLRLAFGGTFELVHAIRGSGRRTRTPAQAALCFVRHSIPGAAVNLIAEGDFVVAEVRGDVLTKRGERYDNEYCIVFRFRGNKIAELVEYCDTDLIERVLGTYEDALKAIEG